MSVKKPTKFVRDMMLNRLCSIVVPVFNGSKYISETIESCIAQDYPEVELILVDDASEDKSFAILQEYQWKYPKVIRTLRNTENRGLVHTFLSGIAASNGTYISGIGQDDIMIKNRITVLVNTIQQRKVSMVCSNAYYIYGNEPSVQLLRPGWTVEGYIPRHAFLLDNPVIGSSALFRKQDFSKISISLSQFQNSMEWIHWFQYISMNGVYYLPLPLLYYRKHNNNLSNSIYQTEEYARYKNFCRKHILTKLSPREIIVALRNHLLGNNPVTRRPG